MAAEPLVALVALNSREMPAESRLLDAFREIRPELGEIGPIEHKDSAWVFRAEGDTAAVSLMPEPIEWSELEESCAGAWYWPEASEALRGHVAHVLVAVQPDGTDRVRAAMTLTAVAAAVARTTQSAGVFWSASGLVHAPDAFVTYARQMRWDCLPLLLWIAFELQEEDEGAYGVCTTGLGEFNRMEIEVHGSRRDPQVLLDRVFDVVHYVLGKGAVLHHGETLGATEDERISITVGPSAAAPGTEVVHLGL